MIKEYGYEYDTVLLEENYVATQGKFTDKKLDNAICLRSGRDALKTVAREFATMPVLIPALSCDSMILPFEMYGHKVVYYKLNFDYTVDMQDLISKIPEGPALLLYMNYFGITAISDDELLKLRLHYKELCFMRDITHDLLFVENEKFAPDFTVASIRKWINVPDGGLLWSKKPLINTEFECDSAFYETRLKAQCMRNEYFKTGDESLKTEYRRIFSEVSDLLDNGKTPIRMSDYSFNIVTNADWTAIKKQRRQNAECLINIFKNADIELIQYDIDKSNLYVPFKVKMREKIQGRLSPQGIFNTVIWPLRDEQINACEVANLTQSMMLAAPCDQRYSIEDMQYIGNEIARVIREEENNDSGG